ncbi:hypothetical protein Tco_1377509 [Tanacetum coccineum]
MPMTIQSGVKDKILATQSETSKARQNVVIDALRRNKQVKPRRVQAMDMTIHYGVRGMILAAQSEAFKRENGMMRTVVMDEAHASRECVIDFGGSYLLSIRCAPFEALYGRKCRSLVIWAEIGGSCLFYGLSVGESSWVEFDLMVGFQETIDKVVLIKEKFKAARDCQKSYVDNSRKPLEFEVGNRELLKVKSWKGVVYFGKKE